MLDKLLVSDILYAATSTGAEFAEVFVESNKKNSLGLINGKLERALSGYRFWYRYKNYKQRPYGLRVYKQKR